MKGTHGNDIGQEASLTAEPIVITLKIGQSEGKESTYRFSEVHDSPATTSRVSVDYEGLTIQSRLKIKSSPIREDDIL